MALPVAVNKRTVTWTLLDDGVPQPGIEVKFEPSARIVNVSGTATTRVADVTATTDVNGTISVQLACTDDVDTSPAIGSWKVSATLAGNPIGGYFDVPVAGSGSIDLSGVLFTAAKPAAGPTGLVSNAGVAAAIGNYFAGVGAGTPEGAVTATPGKLYLRTDGGASTTLYVKTSGTGNTGWTAK